MKNSAYNLPTLEFVGGETNTYVWNMWALSPNEHENKDMPYNANGHTVTFSLVDYTNKEGEPVLSKKCTLREGPEEGVNSVAVTELTPQETYNLVGKFIYQLTVQAGNGETEIPGQGIMYINVNIDRRLVSGANTANYALFKSRHI